jgi:hypothetical protein
MLKKECIEICPPSLNYTQDIKVSGVVSADEKINFVFPIQSASFVENLD